MPDESEKYRRQDHICTKHLHNIELLVFGNKNNRPQTAQRIRNQYTVHMKGAVFQSFLPPGER